MLPLQTIRTKAEPFVDAEDGEMPPSIKYDNNTAVFHHWSTAQGTLSLLLVFGGWDKSCKRSTTEKEIVVDLFVQLSPNSCTSVAGYVTAFQSCSSSLEEHTQNRPIEQQSGSPQIQAGPQDTNFLLHELQAKPLRGNRTSPQTEKINLETRLYDDELTLCIRQFSCHVLTGLFMPTPSKVVRPSICWVR